LIHFIKRYSCNKMLRQRLSTIAARRLAARSDLKGTGLRHASSGGNAGGGAAKVVAGTTLFTLGLGGGALGYAAVDPTFRKMFQETVPGSEQVLNAVLGDLAPPPPPVSSKPVPSKLKIPGPVVVTPPKESKKEEASVLSLPEENSKLSIETEKEVSAIEPLVPEIPAPELDVPSETKTTEPIILESTEPVNEIVEEPISTIPPNDMAASQMVEEKIVTNVESESESKLEVSESESVSETASEPKPEPEPETASASEPEPETPSLSEPEPASEPVQAVEQMIDQSELTPDVENSSLEQVLVELCKEMKAATEDAVRGFDASAEAVITHINIMQKVLESNLSARDENAWNMVFDAASIKSDAIKLAELRDKEANAAVSNVLESISAGRKNKATSTNPQLIVAEEAVNRALYQLEQAKARISAVEGEARVVEQYRDLVEEGRQQFQREMASIMPDVKLGEKGSKLSEDELNLFITHAYRKVLHLQQELAKQQTLEQQRFKQALEKQRIETQMAASEKIDAELERQKRELEVDHQRRLAAMQEESEGELRTQLRRQAAAHSDHLADVLTVQEAELRRKHEHIMDEKLSAAQSEYLGQVAGLTGSLQGLATALTARAEGDKAAVSAQKLWLACVALENSINIGNSEAINFFECVKPLKPEVSAIEEMAGTSQFVSAVLKGIPDTALTRGVYTEQALRDRFCRVETVARRVGGVGDEGASLLRYGLSYLQSLLLVDTSVRSPNITDEPVDVEELSTIDILTKARHSLEKGDILKAVQYMSLLRGEPKRAASDWMSEARLHLEAKQASQALLAHAAAVGLEALPK